MSRLIFDPSLAYSGIDVLRRSLFVLAVEAVEFLFFIRCFHSARRHPTAPLVEPLPNLLGHFLAPDLVSAPPTCAPQTQKNSIGSHLFVGKSMIFPPTGATPIKSFAKPSSRLEDGTTMRQDAVECLDT